MSAAGQPRSQDFFPFPNLKKGKSSGNEVVQLGSSSHSLEHCQSEFCHIVSAVLNDLGSQDSVIMSMRRCGGVVWLTRRTSDLTVGGSRSSPCHPVLSLDKKIYYALSLSTQVLVVTLTIRGMSHLCSNNYGRVI